MKNVSFVGTVAKMIEQDNFNNGCFGRCPDFGIIADDFRAGSIRAVIEKIADFFGVSSDCLEYDEYNNAFFFDREENDNGEEATPAEMERFKAGKIDLLLARYSCEVRRVSECSAREMRAAANAAKM